MPWTVSDVDSHKKGLTPEQKKKWVKIANAALKRCQAKGGSDCDASAIRIANSAFSEDAVFAADGFVFHVETDMDDCCEFAVKPGEPLSNFHSCRINEPNYPEYAYKKCASKSDGKCIDHVYGIPKKGGSELQAMRYPVSSWTATQARKHCGGRGAFTAAKTGKSSTEDSIMNEKLKMPSSALHFMDHECFAKAEGEGEGSKTRLNMVAYSGKPIKNHWYWGDLVIDLDGVKFEKNRFPILENHRTDRKIGFSNGKPIVEDYKLKMDPEKVEFVDTEFAQEFVRLSKQGFPYESSIYGVPHSVERLESGQTASVNGFALRGPAAIWRQWTFKEASVCVFGHDSNTRSEAFANDELELELEVKRTKLSREEEDNSNKSTEKEVISKMTLKELKEQHPEAYKTLTEEAKAEVSDSLKKELEAKFAEEKKNLETKHSEETKSLNGRILELEKRDAIRAEAELKHKADAIWTSKLSESKIPEHLFAKVSQHVLYSKFVKDGVLDIAAFEGAIAAEIKDWEEKGVTSSVLGMGFHNKKETGDDSTEAQTLAKENDDAVNQLSKLAGLKS